MGHRKARRAARLRQRRALLVAGGIAAAALVGVLVWRGIPPDPATLLREANLSAARDPERATRLLQTAIKLSGGHFPEAEAALCRLSARRGDWQTALALFSALDLEACAPADLLEFGELALAAKRPSEAVEALSEVRRRGGPDSLAALALLFSHYRQQNDDRRMLDCVHETAALARDRPELWWKLLEMLDARQLDTEYLNVLNEALRQKLPGRDRSEMQHLLVARLVDQGEADAARRELAALERRDGSSGRTRLHQAAILRLEGKPAAALAMIDSALAEIGEQPGAVRLRALIHFDLAMYREAAEDFAKGVETDPYDLMSHFKLAEAYRKLDRPDLANRHDAHSLAIREKRQRINKLREAARRFPDDSRLLQELAELHRDMNDPRGAALWQERARLVRESGSNP